MKRQTVVEALVFISLVAGGAWLRWHFRELPNFAPVAALALFSGYFFRSWIVGLAVPLSVMMISDQWLGGYHPVMMIVVYGMLAVPVAMRNGMRRYFPIQRLTDQNGAGQRRRLPSTLRAVTGLFGCSLLGAVAFFVVTNFAHWIFFQSYAMTATGLIHCYVQALPFFRYTLAGDALFGLCLFSSYAIAANLGSAAVPTKRMNYAG